MAKTIALNIIIEGLSDITKNVVELEEQIKDLNTQLEQTKVGSEEYINLKSEIVATSEALKQAKKEQRDFVKEATKTKAAEGSYFDLQDQLSKLKKEYKNLSAAEREAAKGTELQQKISALDKELKQIDAGIGQFQRNVGNYPRGIGRIVKSLEQLVPGFENVSKQLTNAEGKLNLFGKALIGGFLAFQAVKVVGRAVKELDEFVRKIDETREAVSQFSDASGENLDKLTGQTAALAKTFDTDAETISEAASSLARNLGISFDEALDKLEGALVQGQGNAEDYLSTIASAPEVFEEASGAVTDFSESNEKLLASNKELAESQVEVAKQLKPAVESMKAFGETVKTQLLLALVSVIQFFKPVFAAFAQFGSAIGELVGALFGAGDAAKGFNTILGLISGSITRTVQLWTFLVRGVTAFVNLLRGDASTAYKLFTKEGALLAETQERLAKTNQEVTKEYTKETKELNKLFGQLANTNKNTKEREEIIKKLNAQYGEYLPNIDLETAGQDELAAAYAQTTKAIALAIIERKKLQIQEEAIGKVLELQLKAQEARQKAEEASIALGETREERAGNAILDIVQETSAVAGLAGSIAGRTNNTKELIVQLNNARVAENEANKEREIAERQLKALSDGADKFAEQLSGLVTVEKLQTEATKVNAKERASDRAKERSENLKQQQEAYKKLTDERRKFLDDETKELRARQALLADLQAKVIDASIKNIENEQIRRIAEIERAFEVEKANFKKQTDALILAANDREARLIETFGKNSKEVLAARTSFNSDLAAIEAQQGLVEVELERRKNEDIKAVNSEFRAKELEEARSMADELRSFRDEALNEELSFIENRAKVIALKNEENLNRLLQGTEDAAERERLIRISAEQQTIEQIALIRNKIQALNDAENELKRQQADEGAEIAQSEYDAILEARQQLNTDLSALELEQTMVQQEQSQQRQKDFQARIESIAGYFEQGLGILDSFIDAANSREEERLNAQADAVAKRQEKISAELENATGLRKKFLEQQLKAETFNAEFIAQKQEEAARKAARADKAIAITQSLIQGFLAVSRAVAAPPGFPINLPSVIAVGALSAGQTAAIAAQKFADGGVIIGPSHAGGGVPFTVAGRPGFEAEGGEFMVNKRATQKFLPVLNHINRFADGGLIGGIPSVPSMLTSGTNELIRAFNQRSDAIAAMVVNSRVILSTDDLDDDNSDRARIEKKATLK